MSFAGRRSGRVAGAAVALAVAACALAVAACALTGSAFAQVEDGSQPRVLVATTGNDSEIRETVPISKGAGKKSRVVMSMRPDRLPSLEPGNRLHVTAELEVTTDCPDQLPRCVGRPYNYNPFVNTRIVLAPGEKVVRPDRVLELDAQQRRCRQKAPFREHHCMFVYTSTMLEVPDRSQLPCTPPGGCYLNMIVDARHPRAKSSDRLLIGQSNPDGGVTTDMGRLNAIRFAPSDRTGSPLNLTTTDPLTDAVRIDKGRRDVVFSQELTGLRRDDQISVNGAMTNEISSLPYNTIRIKSRLVLASSPTAIGPGPEVREITQPRGEIAEGNGFNCTQRKPSCVTNKVGVITMRRVPRDAQGNPIPLYVNMTVDTAKPGAQARASDRVPVLDGGLNVVVFPASMKG